MSMYGRAVIEAIDDTLVIASRHPALFAKVARGRNTCQDLAWAYECYCAGVTSPYWFTGDSIERRERSVRRARGKRQRRARKANRK